ncbi:hypothetical protein GIB67_030015 [Kingdonia uniflora]|uniref:Uncharacterized protein n=1 Tax=Kingdonia uniflora TaxID=39325 RepID=A0A7J7MY33_9MAGN|nr:hypothetical protein GIB67_030015 [Kingdonia uniflora]
MLQDAADNAELVLNNAKEFHSKEMGEWLSTVEVLEGAKMELEIQSHLVNDVRMGLTDSIEITVKDSKMEREVLSKKRDVLMEELEMLLSLVRQKEEEIAETNFTIQEVEKKIDDGVSGFFDAQSSIDMKYQNIQTLLLKTHADNEALLTKKGEIEDFLSQKEKRVGKLRELASTSMDEAKACQELLLLKQCLALPIFESREAKLKLAKIEEKILGDIHMLAEEVSTLRASLQELTSTRSTILQEISSSKQRMSFIDKRIPELESQKKVATSSRNFREAGRVTAEVKTLTAERESIQIKTKASTAELEKIEEEIKDTSEKLHGTEELILMKEKDVAMAQWERLRLVAAASKVERSAALKLGDLEEADILLAEAEAFESQAKELQQTYDFKELANSAEELIAMELIVNLEGEQLAEMAASISPTE